MRKLNLKLRKLNLLGRGLTAQCVQKSPVIPISKNFQLFAACDFSLIFSISFYIRFFANTFMVTGVVGQFFSRFATYLLENNPPEFEYHSS